MRVLFYTETGGYSGAERALSRVAMQMSDKGIEVAAAVPAHIADFVDDLRASSVPVWPLDLRMKQGYPLPFGLPWLDGHNYNALRPIIRRFRPDIVVANMPDPEECIGVAVRARADIPVVGWVHLPQRLEERGVRLGKMRTALCRALLRSFDSFVVPSIGLPEVFARNYGVDRDRVHAVANGVAALAPATTAERAEARARFSVASEKISIALVGRIHFASKGQDVFARALERLGPSSRRFTILVAGDGPDHAALRRMAENTHADWHFLGWRQNVREVFAATDLLAMPSLCEGLALTALEAASMGVPMLLTPVGGNAYVFPAQWLIEADAKAWSERLDSLSAQAFPDSSGWWQAHASYYSLDGMADRMLDVLRERTRISS